MATNLQPYSYYTFKPYYYSFITEIGVEYNCYFTPYRAYFKNQPASIASKFFSFNLELANKLINRKELINVLLIQ